MKVYKTITKEVEECDAVICDICGNSIYEEIENSTFPDLIRTVEINYVHGENWPNGPSYDSFEPNICPKCFRDKIYPIIINLLKEDSLTWKNEIDRLEHDCMPYILKNL